MRLKPTGEEYEAAQKYLFEKFQPDRDMRFTFYHTAQLMAEYGLNIYCGSSEAVAYTPDIQKPPIGLKPKNIHNEERRKEIISAMRRYDDAGMDIPSEWIEELLELNKKV